MDHRRGAAGVARNDAVEGGQDGIRARRLDLGQVMKGLTVEVPSLEIGGEILHVRPHRVDGAAGPVLECLIARQQAAASRRQPIDVAEPRIRGLH
jgi:hypothetical protein